MPRNPELSMIISRKLKTEEENFDLRELDKGISEKTHSKLCRFFEDLIMIENTLEK